MSRLLLSLILLLLVAGCANLEAARHANELRTMRLDNDYCTSHGLRYPDPAYVTCRYSIQNARTLKQWKSLQLAQTASKPNPLVTPPPRTPAPNFHPLNRDRFKCWEEPQFGDTYIFCGERARQ